MSTNTAFAITLHDVRVLNKLLVLRSQLARILVQIDDEVEVQ